MHARTMTGAVLLLAGALGACGRRPAVRDQAAERDRLLAVNDAYRSAWLTGDSAAVLRLFAPDAVLLPHHGDPPVVGLEAIREFWWPPGVPPTTVTTLDITTEDAAVDGDVGTLWGRFTLAFTFEADGRPQSLRNSGTYLMVLRRQPDGEWRITHRMWDDPVARRD
ncbi:MAG TPA: nuclear transport factor 2 family protein [Gemmatimonadales bacterium]|nr:nuclear transport factor 2 family protein [Gemmatimonadales bacterium]